MLEIVTSSISELKWFSGVTTKWNHKTHLHSVPPSIKEVNAHKSVYFQTDFEFSLIIVIRFKTDYNGSEIYNLTYESHPW
jgi:hypothetical protein